MTTTPNGAVRSEATMRTTFPEAPRRSCVRRMIALAALTACGCFSAVAATCAEGPLSIRVEQTDDGNSSGTLVGLDGKVLQIESGGQTRVVPVDGIRRIEREGAPVPPAARLRVTLVDGSWIEGDDIAWDGAVVTVDRADGRGEIPVGKVRSVAWKRADEDAAVPGTAWLSTLPEAIESDLLVVGSAAGHEFVECAIKAIGADSITVVLDDETIPVKRSKVIGVHWLRGEAAAPRAAAGKPVTPAAVEVVGGALRARQIEWSAERLRLDGDVSLPGDALVRLDWASGRTMSLVGVAPERLEVEPWFGQLGRVEGLASYFAPRAVTAVDRLTKPGLVIRPRTLAVWRLPPEGRRFRASIAPAGGGSPAGMTEVVVTVDDREVFRRRVDAAEAAASDGIPIDVDVAGGRRLGVTVDFVSASDAGFPVRFTSPAVEQ